MSIGMTCLIPAALLFLGCQSSDQGKTPDAPVATGGEAGTDGGMAGSFDGGVAESASGDSAPTVSNPALLVPTSDELIAKALESGSLDKKTAAFYGLLAQFAPRRLPPEYQASRALRGLSSVTAERNVAAHLSAYSADEAAAIRAILSSPEDPNWRVFPEGVPIRRLSEGVSCAEAFDSTGKEERRYLGEPIVTRHYEIRALLPKSGEVDRQIELNNRIEAALKSKVPDVGSSSDKVTFAEYLDKVFEFYVDTLHMKDPTGILPEPKTHNGRIPIYVATCDGNNDAISYGPGFIFIGVQVGFEHETWRRIAIAHETMHVFQSGYLIPTIDDHMDWPYEASAVAVEDLVAPSVKRWSGSLAKETGVIVGDGASAMDRLFKCPEEPIHSSISGTCIGRGFPSEAHYRGDYSRFAVIKFYMEEYGVELGSLWYQYAEKGGDPHQLFDKSFLGTLQLALMGDVKGEAPFFKPEDRAAFSFDPALAPDFPPTKLERYTYRSDIAKYDSAWRLTPANDSSALTAGEGVRRLSSSTVGGVYPGGTHRLLIELPPQVADRAVDHPSSYAAEVNFQFQDSDKIGFNIVAVDAVANGPSRVFDPSSTWTETASAVYERTSASYYINPTETAPRYLLATISNFSDGILKYQGSVILVQACLKACTEHYRQYLSDIACPEDWCNTGECTNDYCQELRTECLRNEHETGGGLGLDLFCTYLCEQRQEKPLRADAKPGCVDWTSEICEAAGTSDCLTTWTAFVPVPTWPKLECTDIKQGGKASCK